MLSRSVSSWSGLAQPRRQRGAVGEGDVLLAEVQLQLDERRRLDEGLADGLDGVGDRAAQRRGGRAQAQGALGVDQVGDGLGLSEVQLAVQEGPGRELPGHGRLGARVVEHAQDGLGHGVAAVAGDLNHVLAR